MINKLLVATMMILVFVGCRERVDEVPSVEVNCEIVEITPKYVVIEGSYECENDIEEFGLWYSEYEGMLPGVVMNIKPEGRNFRDTLKELLPGKTYYYQFYFDEEYNLSEMEVASFTTATITPPTVVTKSISDVGVISAICSCEVIDDGNSIVEQRGICWNNAPNPTIVCGKIIAGSGLGTYTCNLTDLFDNCTYYVRAFAINEGGVSYGEEISFVTLQEEEQYPTGYIGEYTYVDLGLPSGLKWAMYNVGSHSPDYHGDRFAWAETETKKSYTNINCQTYGLDVENISGNEEYDVAALSWGDTWRMPTYEEMMELKDYCTWKWTSQFGVKGYRVTGSNGNSIFLPAAGMKSGESIYGNNSEGRYWSASQFQNYTTMAYALDFNKDTFFMNLHNRAGGECVRPVSK